MIAFMLTSGIIVGFWLILFETHSIMLSFSHWILRAFWSLEFNLFMFTGAQIALPRELNDMAIAYSETHDNSWSVNIGAMVNLLVYWMLHQLWDLLIGIIGMTLILMLSNPHFPIFSSKLLFNASWRLQCWTLKTFSHLANFQRTKIDQILDSIIFTQRQSLICFTEWL